MKKKLLVLMMIGSLFPSLLLAQKTVSGKVTDVLEINDTAPFDYIIPDIKQLILNKRRLDFARRLETEIIDEAIKKNEFEVYGNNE